jgi:hypothetical protein
MGGCDKRAGGGGARGRGVRVGRVRIRWLRWFGQARLDVVCGANVGHVRHGARLRSAREEQRAARVSGGASVEEAGGGG